MVARSNRIGAMVRSGKVQFAIATIATSSPWSIVEDTFSVP